MAHTKKRQALVIISASLAIVTLLVVGFVINAAFRGEREGKKFVDDETFLRFFFRSPRSSSNPAVSRLFWVKHQEGHRGASQEEISKRDTKRGRN